jgi:hypothetical protein
VPHSKAEHMAAPTKAANVKKVLANSEPSTHGPKQSRAVAPHMSAFEGKTDIDVEMHLLPLYDPKVHIPSYAIRAFGDYEQKNEGPWRKAMATLVIRTRCA